MSKHIGANTPLKADTVLLTGDPLRAKYIAENFLSSVQPYTTVRGMLGFIGLTPDGKLIAVQGAGMGMPSWAIYVNELATFYGMKKMIRIGTCGAMQQDIQLGSIVIATAACTDSAMNLHRFPHSTFAPAADFQLLIKAYNKKVQMGLLNDVRFGTVFSTDRFYTKSNTDDLGVLADYGVLAVEMETAELYTLAAELHFQALTLLIVSDNIITKEELTPNQREVVSQDMMEIAFAL